MAEMSDDAEIVVSPELQELARRDPRVAEELRDLSACLRQVGHGVETGQYASVEEGVRALLGDKIASVEEADDDGDIGGDHE